MLTNDERLDLDAIELRLLSAQPGPWAVSSEDDSTVFIDVPGGVGALAWFDARDEEDAEFCAHARTDVPALVEELRAERTRTETLRAEHERLWKEFQDYRRDIHAQREDDRKRTAALLAASVEETPMP